MPTSVPKISKRKVRKAGEMLVKKINQSISDEEMFAIINEWRISHAQPLSSMTRLLLNVARSVSTSPMISDRLKRLPSIETKLREFPQMNLTTMQDIAGCRAIMDNLGNTKKVVEQIQELVNDEESWEIVNTFDYISRPKPDGYRGIHLIFQVKSETGKLSSFFGLKVEVQFRTHLQHVWATALEVVSMFTHQDLKRQKGSDEWKRFFVLASAVLGDFERLPPPLATPSKPEDTITELKILWNKLNVEYILENFTHSISDIDINLKSAVTYVIELNTKERTVKTLGFENDALAWETQVSLEKEYRDIPFIDVVMVNVDLLSDLRDAYPNYFLDTGEFLEILEKVVNFEYIDYGDINIF